MMTIKQLADRLEVSKTAVRKYMSEDFRKQYTQTAANGVITINADGCKLIAATLERSDKLTENNENKFAETTENTANAELIAFLRAEIEFKNQQITTLQEQNTQLANALQATAESLKASQALHAGTMQQQLEAPKKSFWDRFKKEK